MEGLEIVEENQTKLKAYWSVLKYNNVFVRE